MPNKVDEKSVQSSKILIVDDEQIILNIASDVLKSEGYEIETTQDPREALEKIKTKKFDFLLTDIKMPHIDGMTLAKEAQKISPDTGTIFMTGYASLDTAKEAIKAGAYDYIMKPFELAELRKGIAKAVAKKAKLEESSGGQDLNRLSDLMEVLYNVGERDSLLKLSLGLALLNCNLEVGLIAAWDERSEKLEVAATNNVKEGNFKVISQLLSADAAEKCFDIGSPARNIGIKENPFFAEIIKQSPEIEKLSEFFNESNRTITIAVKSQKKFYIVLLLQESVEDTLNERDLKLLSIVLSLISLAAENIALYEESKTALSELEKLHDDIVNLEKVAAKGVMSAEIGHELNNFLNIVRSNFEMMTYKARIKNETEVAKYIDSINMSLDQMTKFTSGLADAANLRTEKKMVNLNVLLEDIAAFLSPQKRFRNIDIIKNLDDSLPNMMADSSQLSQLFYNILNNASQALHDHKEGLIRIITRFDKENHEAVVELSDNGPGFPPELAEKAFTSRFTTKPGGHGFGLIVCAKVVNNHGGKIKIEKVEPHGSRFMITLPVISDPRTGETNEKQKFAQIRV
ncbi:MAG: response regulator [candidate division Zixibacteria bacterium]|nr:response regulator [candidate division Zixibacteria bacterium]NIR64509.1 response regulator [candidate division Zixibacteria bacterium]NIS16578.1 response regulator [candidate division Zixibacteria bacterium]NIS46286.1 response regulator [candidate division Zixibacteria bacterium]NIT52940.1 response regulator [candidate division Zixibacteria bacterium]